MMSCIESEVACTAGPITLTQLHAYQKLSGLKFGGSAI